MGTQTEISGPYVRPGQRCDAGCNRGWLECGGIEDDSSLSWVQMCDNCTSHGTADDSIAAQWASDDTGLAIGYAFAYPFGRKESYLRPYLIGGSWGVFKSAAERLKTACRLALEADDDAEDV